MSNIITKNIEIFLEAEYLHYKGLFDSYREYELVMQDGVSTCNRCGVCYWSGCDKRCSCV